MSTGAIIAVGLFFLLLIAIGILVWAFGFKKEKECEKCPTCPSVPTPTSQYFLGKECPTGFATITDLSIPFKSTLDQPNSFITAFTAITADPLARDDWTYYNVKLCKGALTATIPGVNATANTKQLYAFADKSVPAGNLQSNYATARLLYESSKIANSPFNSIPITDTYGGTIMSRGVEYRYVEANLVNARNSQYVLADTAAGVAKLGLEIPSSSNFAGFTLGNTGITYGTTSTFNTVHPIYNLRWGASTLEGFCINQIIDQYTPQVEWNYPNPLNQYTQTPQFYINQFNPVNNTLSYFNTQCTTDFVNQRTSAQFRR